MQVWGAYFVGITNRLVNDLFSNTLGEAIEYGTSLYKEIIVATIIMAFYLWVYYRLAKFLLSVMKKKRRGEKKSSIYIARCALHVCVEQASPNRGVFL